MPDTDRTLEVLIKLGYIGSDQADKAREDLKSFGAETEKTGEKTIEFGKRGVEMRLLFSELNRVIPGLGDALRGLNLLGFNPIIATLSLVAFGFYEAKKAIDTWNKSLDDAALAAADPTFLEGINAKITVLNSAKTAAEEYAKKEQDVLTSEQGITTALTEQLQMMAAIEQARGADSTAQKALALAKIGKLEAEGQITPSQAITQRTDIESYYEAQDFARKQQAEQQAQATREAALKKAETDQEQLDRQKKSADEAAIKARTLYGEYGDEFKKVDTSEKVSAALQPFHDQLKPLQDQFKRMQAETADLPPDKQAATLAPYRAAIDRATATLSVQEKYIRRVQELGSGTAKEKADALTTIATDAEKKATENSDAIKKLSNEVSQGAQRLSATGPLGVSTEKTRQEIFGVEETTELEKQSASDLQKYRGFLDRKDRGGVTQQDFKDAITVLQDMHDAMSGHAEVIKYIKSLGVDVRRVDVAQQELEREMRQYQTQLEHTQSYH